MKARSALSVLVLGGACLTAVAVAPAAHAASCTGTKTWVADTDGDWAEGSNWSGGTVPSAGDAVMIAGHNVDGASGTVCSLAFDFAGGMLTSTGLTVTGDFSVQGGPDSASYTELAGSYIAGSTHITGPYASWVGSESSPSGNTWVTGSLDIAAGTSFSLADSGETITVNGSTTLGAGSDFDSNASSGDSTDNAVFNNHGAVTLEGNATSPGLVVNSAPGSTIDLNGHTWLLFGVAFSTFHNGTTIKSSAPRGTLVIDNGEKLILDGAVTVIRPATVQLAQLRGDSFGYLSSPSETSSRGRTGTLTGNGTFLWTNGQISGTITLARELVVLAAGAGDKTVADENYRARTKLINRSTHFTVTGGTLETDAETESIENAGSITFRGGSFGANSSSAKPLANDKGARIIFASKVTEWGAGRGILNRGAILIAPKVRVSMSAFTQTSTGTLQLTVGGTAARNNSTLRITYSRATLAGRLTLVTAKQYRPRIGTSVRGLLTSSSGFKGRFGRVVSSSTPKRTAWTARVRGSSVNATLVSIRRK